MTKKMQYNWDTFNKANPQIEKDYNPTLKEFEEWMKLADDCRKTANKLRARVREWTFIDDSGVRMEEDMVNMVLSDAKAYEYAAWLFESGKHKEALRFIACMDTAPREEATDRVWDLVYGE